MTEHPGTKPGFRLYAVADTTVTAAPDFADRLARLGEMAGKRVAVYVRDDSAEAAAIACDALAPCGTPVFVRAAAMAAAVAAGRTLAATGVHLTAAELAGSGITRRVRRTDTSLLVAASVHDAAEVVRARDAACAFVVFGHVFETPGKPGIPGRGVTALQSACAAAAPMPVFAIGGIRPMHVEACRGAGAHGVAAASGIFSFPDPRPLLEAFLESLEGTD